MWLTTTIGFYSIVKHHEEKDIFLIRARSKKHLNALIEVASKENIFGQKRPEVCIDKSRDYWFRLFVTTREMESIVCLLAQRINYTNFKNAAKVDKMTSVAEQDFLSNVWRVGYNFQREVGTKRHRHKWIHSYDKSF